ncbi:TonB-dependent receptor [Aliikangiella sp. GXAS 306]|uniref:TonB-dependent receptor n=1 Tax=Aliikangiella maris TaxID=3162458 RepID=A0ABV3MJ43_9GAMM
MEELLKIKVSVANRHPTPVRQAASSVTIFTAEQIQSYGLQTLEELLALVPGVQMNRSENGGGGFSASFRGRRADNGANRDILVLIDGARLNEPVEGGAMEQERQISLFNAQRVEVIRGPGSTLYGANAFLGVVNIITNKEENKLTLQGGNLSAKGAAFQTHFHWKKLQVALAGEYYADNGDHFPAFYEFWGVKEDTQDPALRKDIQLNIDYQKASLLFRRNEREYRDFVSQGAQLNGLQKQLKENQLLRLAYSFEWDDVVDEKENRLNIFAESQWGVSDYLTGLFPENPQPPIDPASGLYWTDGSLDALVGGNYREIRQHRIGIDGVEWLNQQHLINYGFSVRKESISRNPFQGNWDAQRLYTTGEYVPSPPEQFIQKGFWLNGERYDLFSPESRRVWGAYLQDSWHVNDQVQLTAGVRLDDYEEFSSNLSFRGGVIYQFNQHYWKLLLGEAFRAPTFIESKAGIASGGIANPALRPENVTTSELIWGVEKVNWSSQITLFKNHFSEVVVPVWVDDIVPGITAFQPQNLGSDSNMGIEFEWRWQVNEKFQLNIIGDRLVERLDSFQPVADSRLAATLMYDLDAWKFSGITRYVGKVSSRLADNGQTAIKLSDYWLTDLTTLWQVNSNMLLSFDLSNLFDEKTQHYTAQSGLEQGLPGRGREFLLKAEYRF